MSGVPELNVSDFHTITVREAVYLFQLICYLKFYYKIYKRKYMKMHVTVKTMLFSLEKLCCNDHIYYSPRPTLSVLKQCIEIFSQNPN